MCTVHPLAWHSGRTREGSCCSQRPIPTPVQSWGACGRGPAPPSLHLAPGCGCEGVINEAIASRSPVLTRVALCAQSGERPPSSLWLHSELRARRAPCLPAQPAQDVTGSRPVPAAHLALCPTFKQSRRLTFAIDLSCPHTACTQTSGFPLSSAQGGRLTSIPYKNLLADIKRFPFLHPGVH